jgi:hypothetical protein
MGFCVFWGYLMRIPPSQLSSFLEQNAPVAVRTSDYGCFNSAMPYTDAIALAARGEVEAVATRGGKVRYLRLLTEAEKPPRLVVEDVPAEEIFGNTKSSVVARTEMGVYRQQVESVRSDESGVPMREVIGYVWAHCALRGAGI